MSGKKQTCPNERHHRAGAYCKTCGQVQPGDIKTKKEKGGKFK